MSTALLIIAHGSRLASSNEEVIALKDKIVAINRKSVTPFTFIEAAFLELATPSIPEGIQISADQGVENIIIFPYFLAKGRHVKEDIPNIVEEAKKHHPQVNIQIVDYFGRLPGIENLILDLVSPKK